MAFDQSADSCENNPVISETFNNSFQLYSFAKLKLNQNKLHQNVMTIIVLFKVY
jgi:hypothetical protein